MRILPTEGQLPKALILLYTRTKYDVLKPTFIDVMTSFEASDEPERMSLFLRVLNRTYGYTPEQIKHLKPDIVRFFEENPLEVTESETADGALQEFLQQEIVSKWKQ